MSVSLIQPHSPAAATIPCRPVVPLPGAATPVWFPVARCDRGTGGLVRFRLACEDGSEIDGPVFFGRSGPLDDLLRAGGLASVESVRFLAIERVPTAPAGRVVEVR